MRTRTDRVQLHPHEKIFPLEKLVNSSRNEWENCSVAFCVALMPFSILTVNFSES